MDASLTTGKGTMLWATKASSSTVDYRDIYAQPADGRPVRWVATAYWSSSQLAWRHAGRNYADLHSLMRDVAVPLEADHITPRTPYGDDDPYDQLPKWARPGLRNHYR